MTQRGELPHPRTHGGDLRKVGIEVELGGLDEEHLARALANQLGGTVSQTDGYVWEVTDSALGRIEILLDTHLRDKVQSNIAKAGLDLSRAVIPVEFVTEPILPEQIEALDSACRTLAEAGAFGTQDGVMLGFGVHLNVALPGPQVDDILPVLTAFALIEDWMREKMQIDVSRRILPFVDTYPTALLDRLCDDGTEWTLDVLVQTYLDAAPSRNYALDLLPILKHLDSDRVVEAVPQMEHKSARPAWHYRLPDCRIDAADWSIGLEWERWCAVERVAADPALLEQLKQCWRRYRARALPIPGRWRAHSAELLDRAVVLP